MRLYAIERRGHDARNRGFGLASCSRGLVFLRGALQGQRAEDGVPRGGHCRPKCPTRLPTGWHRRCWTLFRVQQGRLFTSFPQRVRRTRGKKPRVRTRILLPRPGAPARGHYRPKEPETGVPRRGHCRPTNIQRGYRQVGTVGFCHFSGAVIADSRAFPPTSEERHEARYHGFGFASCSRGLVFPDGDIAGPNSNTAIDPSLQYSTDKVVLSWQPPSYFPPWSPLSFAVDDVPYSCAEQYMMAEKTKFFRDHQAVGLVMSSPSPSTRK